MCRNRSHTLVGLLMLGVMIVAFSARPLLAANVVKGGAARGAPAAAAGAGNEPAAANAGKGAAGRGNPAAAAPGTGGEQVGPGQGESSILGDLDSGMILHEQDADSRRDPASLTKVMTLHLVFDALVNGDLTMETKLPVSEKAWRVGGSKTFVKVGEMVSLEDLIRGISVQSGNDACMVVAEHIGGSEKGFAEMMNAKARELKMTNSHFQNPSGLPDSEHYSTARDLFLLAQSIARKFPQFLHFFQEKQYTFNGIRQYNRNRLLWRDPSITGMKTGHTADAGYCLIATSEKEGQRLGAVVMGAKSSKIREEEALRLLRYGNRMFETVRLFEVGASVRKLRVWKGTQETVEVTVAEPLVVTVARKDRAALEVGLKFQEPLSAPIKKGDPIGTLVVSLGERELMSRPAVADRTIEKGGFFRSVIDTIRLKMGW
ncbi:MAG: D-alanyl-D-alanine carboxypeptidase [Magnetococcales bacterium]|nr:D-alanyl-D-alanine carboxypeptidase [Magnetococcales bacterium]